MDFYFYTSSAGRLTDAIARLKQKESLEPWTRKLNPFGVFTYSALGEGLVLEAQDIMDINPYRQAVQQILHADPTLKFHFIIDEFHYDKDGNYAGVISMLRVCSTLLGELGDDAVLLAANHEVILQRKNGRLILNTEWGFWNPYRISQISIPYCLELLPAVRLILKPSL